jgi:hypothetical protein
MGSIMKKQNAIVIPEVNEPMQNIMRLDASVNTLSVNEFSLFRRIGDISPVTRMESLTEMLKEIGVEIPAIHVTDVATDEYDKTGRKIVDVYRKGGIPLPLEYAAPTRFMGIVPFSDLEREEIGNKIPVAQKVSFGLGFRFYNDRFEIAFGENVYACINFNLWGESFVTTGGTRGIPFEQFMDALAHKLTKRTEIWRNMSKAIDEAQDTTIRDEGDMIAFFGALSRYSAAYAAPKEVPELLKLWRLQQDGRPFAQDELLKWNETGAFIRATLREVTGEDGAFKPISAYNLYNIGTNLMKPGVALIDSMWEKTNALHDMIMTVFPY